ncbi:MAG TPA: hypothetical protein PLO61_01715 [Fimbriimonadaceae bacterium]|nr:hypothetical protein [Fimbriimonadaceae bacterium]HRJ32243.1 hypothetical protein [Fimbriimonadaceae bacterium]
MQVPFYYHPRMLSYVFGEQHPLKPERLRRAIGLIQTLNESTNLGLDWIDPGLADERDILRIHTAEYWQIVQEQSQPDAASDERAWQAGFGWGDNPSFIGMAEASRAYLAGSVAAAKAVISGHPLALSIAGGLHHAAINRARGFCILNDVAIACHVLRDHFSRVAYVDLDVHHGEGVQWAFEEDTTVLTTSIHESGRTLFPGTGYPEETSVGFSSVNVPLEARTSGDVWLGAFREGLLPALRRFEPEAIVLQMGTDPHFADPLGHLMVRAQDWWAAIADVRDLGVPIVAVGGGGYNLSTVPRMWAGAVLTLLGRDIPERIPDPWASAWDVEHFADPDRPCPADAGEAAAQTVLETLQKNVHPFVPTASDRGFES